ncbi:MAG: PAS domain S-box protein, partial [Methanoregula sp.]|nr:PAS domain S-box protein [Methanoregula sp.]
TSLASGIPDEEILLSGNEERIFRKKIIPTVFEDGKKGMTILLEDISLKKAAEKDLAASEERFRLMAENIQDGITIWEEKKITFMNKRAEEIFGYNKNELSLMSPADLAAPQERERLREVISRSMESKSIPSDLTFWIERKDGSRRFILNRITSVKHAKGVTCYIITTDFTEWKQANDALENQLGFLQHMINTYPNPLFYRDMQGRYLGCNTAFSNLIGKMSGEIAGKTSEDVLGNDQASVFLRHDEDLMKGGDLFTFSSAFTRPDGTHCQLKIQKSRLVLTNGNTAGTVGLVLAMEDITPVKPL